MPGKEAVVEVEKAVVPEPVTKEIPKCEGASKDVGGKEGEDSQPAKTTETAPIVDSAESKPQDTEITSSAEQKTEKVEPSSGKAEKEEPSVESTNGSVAKPEEKEVTKVDEGSELNGKTKPVESAESIVDSSAEGKNVGATAESAEGKNSEAKETPAESVDTKGSEAEVAETKPDPMEIEAKPEAVSSVKTETKSSEATPPAKVEPMEDGAKSSEAAAKPLPADDEKIVVEKESKSGNPVSGSDEVTEKDAAQDGCEERKDSTSADSSTEKKTEKPSSSESETKENPGSSSATSVKPDLETQISELKKQGLALYVKKDYCAAADAFGKILEVQAPIYGEMSEKLAETYFLYGTAMYEYGKVESGVLGEKVKEKDEPADDEEEGEDVEQMEVDDKQTEVDDMQTEVDDKEAEPAETTADKPADRPSTPSGYGEEDADKEPADVTITEDKEDDDDAFRVAWEMLELAKATFQKADNKKRLADTLVKLGEVGIEIENVDAVAEMEEGLKIRKEVYPENHRIISETHFNIGLAYAAFDKYDDAIQHFAHAKDCLEKRIEELSKSETKEDKSEVEEMKSLLPEIQEKIDDTKESKADKEKLKEKIEGELLKKAEPAAPFPAPSGDKPVSNISHLVKRKRKVDEILPERAAKQSRQDADVASTTSDVQEGVESSEPADVETATEKDSVKVDGEPEQVKETKPAAKSEEKPESKTEEKPDLKPEAKTEEKLGEKPEETEKAVELAKTEEAKPAETEPKSSEPEKMEE